MSRLWRFGLIDRFDILDEVTACGPPSHDPRPRLSASQQAQILSDVQQHQQRYRRPQEVSNSFPNVDHSKQQPGTLAKYKVDRSKQQQIQQLLQQQQQVQQLIQQQQQKIAQQLSNTNYLGNAPSQVQASPKQQQFSSQYSGQFQNLQHDLSQPLFSDQQTVQLQEYLAKQQELELLQKQRQQLLLEQQELRRQQELLRLQQLRKLTSTTPVAVTEASPSTTSSPVLVSLPTARKITPSETQLFLKAIATHQKKYSTTPIPTTTSKPTTVTQKSYQTKVTATQNIPENLLSLIQDQESRYVQQGKEKPQIKIVYQTEKPTTERAPTTRGRSALNSERDILLKQLKLALAQSVDDDVRNVSTRDIVLPNGKKIQFIDAPSGSSTAVPSDSSSLSSTVTLATTTTIKPPKAILEELTKGVLPPGADFEVIRQKSDGKLEEIGKAPIQSLPAKKVTFVVLEEQPDGSYKVQGVKGNADKEGSDVESIVEKIKKGELKLPPSSSNPVTTSSLENVRTSLDTDLVSTRHSSTTLGQSTGSTTFRPTSVRSTLASARYTESKPTEYFPHVTISPNSVSSTDKYMSSASSVATHVFNSLSPSNTTPKLSPVNQDGQVIVKYSTSTKSHFIPTMAPVNEIITTTPSLVQTTFPHHSTNSYVHFTGRPTSETTSTFRPISTTSRPALHNENTIYQEGFERSTFSSPTELPSGKGNRDQESLTTLLKREGLFAMTKYLKQSGLDSVLNETGPYTLFVPTDKAFRTLLVQLGGPEKAEQKFQENPRLLSGLLLHHVIPGAFRIDTLQDEMTGVSLAGTQLRVNEYTMHDHEWNDVKVTTINGAKVAPNKHDIEIPQGVAHAVDKVMFPLPVGDLVQTLQADRERRFTTFLKMLYISGLQDTLAGPKTFTIFAPTDAAFNAATSKDGTPVWTDEDGPEAAKAIVSRHIIPSTLYTAGMRYYLQKDTLRSQSPVHIHKNGGRVKVNEAHVVTHNVPATNGVLHAIDGVL
ncbi:mucin-12-like [Hylaeus anthracinus]|uniref:mucin-12-like n=1 Tax=Hylaeus anthracinus TaxID=313031 RepID=UPI0023B90CDA|nr:mucin-12-like [Hylaeus anthracinus]